MTDRHWSDLAARKAAKQRKAVTRPQTLAAPSGISAKNMAVERAAAQNPRLNQLMDERSALEERMHAAAGGGALAGSTDPRDALRFQVPSMAERRGEYERWARLRDRPAGADDDVPYASAPARNNPAGDWQRPMRPGTPEPTLRETPGETPRGSPLSAQDWLERRGHLKRNSGLSAAGRGADDVDARLDERLDRARSAAGRAREIGRSVDEKLRDLDSQFDQADSKLVEQGASESDRAELKKIKKDLGLDNYTKARDKGDTVLSKPTVLSDRYSAAKRKVEDNWLARRDAIGGADTQSYMRPLRALNDRVLGMGMVDIEERAANLKAAALEKRRAAREEENSDAARRERALEKRRSTRDGD